MKLHEYQAKHLFTAAGLPVPEGVSITSANEAVATAEALGYPVAIKAQVHAGGRGKAGGVRLVRNRTEAEDAVKAMLGMQIQTGQTGGQVLAVKRLLLEKGIAVERELYLSLVVDRATACHAIIASLQGGMEIEELARSYPERIVRVGIDPLAGLQPHHLRRVAFGLGLEGEQFHRFCGLLQKLYVLFCDKDLLLAEINPLALTIGGELLILDAKVETDDNALYRHPELAALHDPAEDDPLEAEAAKYKLSYIRLDGTVGNMVNGAGLAMATMDMIKQAGAEPANFLDVGGGASEEMIENGLRILLSDSRVKAVLINIFGGILRCDILASGVVAAAKRIGLPVPVVVRMEGTNVEEGRAILAGSGLPLITAVDFREAAEKIAEVAG